MSKVGSHRKRELCLLAGLVFSALGAWSVLVNQPLVLHLQVPFPSLQVAPLRAWPRRVVAETVLVVLLLLAPWQ